MDGEGGHGAEAEEARGRRRRGGGGVHQVVWQWWQRWCCFGARLLVTMMLDRIDAVASRIGNHTSKMVLLVGSGCHCRNQGATRNISRSIGS